MEQPWTWANERPQTVASAQFSDFFGLAYLQATRIAVSVAIQIDGPATCNVFKVSRCIPIVRD